MILGEKRFGGFGLQGLQWVGFQGFRETKNPVSSRRTGFAQNVVTCLLREPRPPVTNFAEMTAVGVGGARFHGMIHTLTAAPAKGCRAKRTGVDGRNAHGMHRD